MDKEMVNQTMNVDNCSDLNKTRELVLPDLFPLTFNLQPLTFNL
jgi:hypothetical protein